LCLRPQRTIRSLPLTPIQYMRRIMAPRAQPPGESLWQLVIHEKFHAAVARTR
jgi:hypothetical protein